MRCLTTILCFVISTLGGAQSISNPDFENGCSPNSSGWGGSPWSLGPGYQSCYALQFHAGESWYNAYTPILGLQEEVPYELDFWARKTSSYIFGMAHVMGFTPGETPAAASKPGFDALISMSWLWDEEWTPLTIAFTIPVFIPELDYFIVLSPDNFTDNGFGTISFDEFVLTSLSTGLSPGPNPGLGVAPNPATDKIRVDLPDVPLSIIAIDASGRTHDLKNFTHRDRTLEVDVNALPNGITLLRITNSSGTQNLRFIKL